MAESVGKPFQRERSKQRLVLSPDSVPVLMAAAYQDGAGGQKGIFSFWIDQGARQVFSWIMRPEKLDNRCSVNGQSIFIYKIDGSGRGDVAKMGRHQRCGVSIGRPTREDPLSSAAARCRSHLGFSVSLSKCRHHLQYQRRDGTNQWISRTSCLKYKVRR